MAGNKQTNKLMKFSRRLNFGAGTLAGIGITGITSQLFSLEGDEDYDFRIVGFSTVLIGGAVVLSFRADKKAD
ncbi:hypothetical protein GCM10011506_09530 [Marivirga lumbricoides]|uniref:Uncharacterized protein n=2 Tax=Marivirga lumbricoides TaxID=1046115 RepID=A0ABQ1LQY6_9BACT|nr:hypothetical protein GCM10011506_09530 [Marivirga lumbricoides]